MVAPLDLQGSGSAVADDITLSAGPLAWSSQGDRPQQGLGTSDEVHATGYCIFLQVNGRIPPLWGKGWSRD